MPTSRDFAPTDRNNRVITLTAVGLLGIFVGTCAGLTDTSTNIRLFQVAYALGFMGYGLLAYCVCNRKLAGRWSIWLIGCVIARLALIHTVPSDDLYRYLWEGRIQIVGHNPYALAPDDPKLTSLRNSDWQQINHPDYTAIYPPLAQLTFLALAHVTSTVYGYKAINVAFDILAILLLASALKRLNKPPHLSLLYGLCPLTLTAIGIEGHIDAMLVAFLAAALHAQFRDRHYQCAAFIALATLTRTIPILLLPWLWRCNYRAGLLATILIAVGYLPYVDAGLGLFDSVIRFGGGTQLLGFGYALLSTCFGPQSARWLGAATIAGVAMWQAWRRTPLPRCMFAVLSTTILLMPVVHFWYLVWILLLLPFTRRISWCVLAASMIFYFEAAHQRNTQGDWIMPTWVPFFVYTPFVTAWAIELWLVLRRGQRGDSGMSNDLR